MAHKNEVAYNPFAEVALTHAPEEHPSLHPYSKPHNMLEASVLYKGHTGRMRRMLQKAASGEPVSLVTLGGSITEGSGRSDGAYYGDLLYQWFQTRFGNAQVRYTNAGRGTTTSLFGCARIERDILPLAPDLIVVEYAVNDTILQRHIAQQAFEAVLRKLLNLPGEPCVLVLFTCLGELGSTQPLDTPIAQYYELPMASYGDALAFHLEHEKGLSVAKAKEYIADTFIYDGVHPTTYGYRLLCDFITFQFEAAMQQEGEIDILPVPEKPFCSDRLVSAHISDSQTLKVLENSGWEPDDRQTPYRQRGYAAAEKGAQICFSFDCRVLTMVSRKSVSPRAGVVMVQIDEGDPFEIDSYFHNGWGTYNDYRVIIDDDHTAHHTVRITFTGHKPQDALEKAAQTGIDQEEVGTKFILVEFLPA